MDQPRVAGSFGGAGVGEGGCGVGGQGGCAGGRLRGLLGRGLGLGLRLSAHVWRFGGWCEGLGL